MKVRKFLVSWCGWLFVSDVEYHRNGVGGAGFYAVKFRVGRAYYLATVFDAPGHVAVVCLQQGGAPLIDADHRVRGDVFEDGLRRAVAAYDEVTGDWATEEEIARRKVEEAQEAAGGALSPVEGLPTS